MRGRRGGQRFFVEEDFLLQWHQMTVASGTAPHRAHADRRAKTGGGIQAVRTGVRQGKEGNGGHDHEGSSAGINNVLNLFSSSLSMIHLVLCLNDTSVLGTWVGSVPRLED